MSFHDGFEQIKRQAEGIPLKVLVWGPGAGGADHYEKRLQVQQRLQERFHQAEVRFSEELNLSEVLPSAEELSLQSQESWHLEACDLCIVLDTSKGAGEEIAYFANMPLAYKLLILTHEQHQVVSSFPGALRRNLNQVFYNEHEYTSCSLIECVLVRLTHVAFAKLFKLPV